MWVVLCGTCLWVLVYIALLRSCKFQTTESISHFMALLHSFIACRGIELFLLSSPIIDLSAFGELNTHGQNMAVQFSLSYFVFETAYCVWSHDEGWVMMLHHFVSLLALSTGHWLGASGYEICLLIWSAEFTNPLLQVRWFARSHNLHTTVWAKINEAVFVVLFIFFRGVFGCTFSYHVYLSTNKTHYVMQYFAYTFQLVNFLFLGQVMLLIRKRLCGSVKPATS